MTRQPPSLFRGAGLALVLLLLVGCSQGGSSPSGDPIEHPRGASVLFRIETEGGFVAPGEIFGRIPSFTLLGDGRVFTEGAVAMIFPGPILPPVMVRTLSEVGIQAVLHEVARTGLFTENRDFNGAQNVVADAPTTVFTLNAEGKNVRISVYGLGTFDAAHRPASMTAAEAAAHAALSKLNERLTTLDTWLGASAWVQAGWQPYRPDAFRLLVRNADAELPDQSGIGNNLVPWPGSIPAARFGDATQSAGARCGVVTGPDAGAWYDGLVKANQLTRFVSAGHRYVVTPRPLLPDEPRVCPS